MSKIRNVETNAINEYCSINTEEDFIFNYITTLASEICTAPIAYLCFIAGEKVYYKNVIGKISAIEMPVTDKLSDMLSAGESIVVVDNLDKKLGEKILFNAPDINFFVSVPLLTTEGLKIGALSVLNTQKQPLSVTQQKTLNTLALMTMSELERRLKNKKETALKNQHIHKLIHDINNRNTAISLSTEIILAKLNEPSIIKKFTEKIKSTTVVVIETLQKIKNLNKQ